MRSLIALLVLFLFSCNNRTVDLGDFAIAQWELTDRVDSIDGADCFFLPKVVVCVEGKFHVYRFDPITKSYSYGQILQPMPDSLIEQLQYLEPARFDTIHPVLGNSLDHHLRYSFVDLMAKKVYLFRRSDIGLKSIDGINQLLDYADKAELGMSSDTTIVHFVREEILKKALLEWPPLEKRK